MYQVSLHSDFSPSSCWLTCVVLVQPVNLLKVSQRLGDIVVPAAEAFTAV